MSLGTRACVTIQTRKGLHRDSPKLRLHVAIYAPGGGGGGGGGAVYTGH